ncbi:MAG TPA: hypothetical protein PLY97_06960 [Acidocella sp.]|nr:MAG: hypothetical protein B7Z80_21090 [Rhodospirillales bacterium 20-64-7]HQT46946.1 hypothetical protein [Acidocella sp.]
MRGTARKFFYPAIFLLIGAGWWFGGTKLFLDAAHTITAALLPPDVKPAGPVRAPQVAVSRPAPTPAPAPVPKAPDVKVPPPPNTWATDPRAVAALAVGQQAIKAGNCQLAQAKLRTIREVWGHDQLYLRQENDTPEQRQVQNAVGALFYYAQECEGRKAIPNAPPDPKAEEVNHHIASAKTFEASNMLQWAGINYKEAYDLSPKGPRAQEAVLGIIQVLIERQLIPEACDSLNEMRKEWPKPRPDLVPAIAAARQQTNCGP